MNFLGKVLELGTGISFLEGSFILCLRGSRSFGFGFVFSLFVCEILGSCGFFV